MPYLEQVRADADHNRYKLMHDQVVNAAAVCAGTAVLDRELFAPVPVSNEGAPKENNNVLTAVQDVTFAFAAGIYGQVYGPVSERQQFSHLEPVDNAVRRWSHGLTSSITSFCRPAQFNTLFFDGGLWHVFVDRWSGDGTLRKKFEAAGTDFSKLKKDPDAQAVAKEYRPLFSRTKSAPSHTGSHPDAMHFANAVLDIGEHELGLTDQAEKVALLQNSLPELRRLTLLDMPGVELATKGFMFDHTANRHRKKYLTIDDTRNHVGFNMDLIQDRILEEIPDVASHNHRGCTVIYQRTQFNERQVPIFSAMNETLLRAYQATGALVMPTLRSLRD